MSASRLHRLVQWFALALCLAPGACSDTLTFADIVPQAPKFELKSLPSSPARMLGPPTLIGPDGSCVRRQRASSPAPASRSR